MAQTKLFPHLPSPMIGILLMMAICLATLAYLVSFAVWEQSSTVGFSWPALVPAVLVFFLVAYALLRKNDRIFAERLQRKETELETRRTLEKDWILNHARCRIVFYDKSEAMLSTCNRDQTTGLTSAVLEGDEMVWRQRFYSDLNDTYFDKVIVWKRRVVLSSAAPAT